MSAEFIYFSIDDFACQETGENAIDEEFIHKLDALRERCGFPFVVTSGYRSPRHSIEAKKPNGGGKHTEGIAADIAASTGDKKYTIVKEALVAGFTGIGVHKSFIHLDTRDSTPVLWAY
jgi:zinc D-Ala-D-Ala carboxypeptidase